MLSNQIILGDCFDVLPTLDSDSADMVFFSPPYDEVRDYSGFTVLDKEHRIILGKELLRIIKDGGVCVVVIQDGTKDRKKTCTTHHWVAEWVDAGWNMFETCIYSRDGRPGAWWNKRFRVDHEYILIFFKGDDIKCFDKEPLKIPAKHAGQKWHGTQRLTDGTTIKVEEKIQADLKCRGTIWRYNTSNSEGNQSKKAHPATMPDDLAADAIKCFSKEGDLVLDPMSGSGTTLVMAANLRRRYLGIEVSKKYKQIIDERIASEVKDDIFRDK